MAYLRVSQMKAAELENSYLVTSRDKDYGFIIHPSNQKVVAEALRLRIKNTYKRNNSPVSPSYK